MRVPSDVDVTRVLYIGLMALQSFCGADINGIGERAEHLEQFTLWAGAFNRDERA